ncbi:UDP-N-acetylmuramoyl-L-alanine--D-glutamate ligase [Alteromonas portus]|uniref:UDP-N-acetylmuramoylalanine--D-glutamate ligase n=1 Tax=Alteromonas portus TaxID=2565549 RepID=A0A4U0ZH41_9ALTE|nr:UDP-N-acetylmuramoyl-L-alanine--D-glutamate ligase [Alteromonas portus]TKB03295.1 UDP-N-acetylmuramoyl-L-alanine--D-glutamate ligase [Alteromonas portus]
MAYNVREHSYVVGGLGVTGQACVRFLLQKRATVKAFDTRANFTLVTDPDSGLDTDMQAFMANKITCSALSENYFEGVDTLVLSPGLALNIEQVALAQKCGVEVIGDVELFARLNATKNGATPAKRVVGITGSNGKTTVTLLVNHLLKSCGVKSIEAGNVGRPVLEALQSDADVVVMELSSFQLETTSSLELEAATVLNISDDHLDRHGTLEAYIEAKHRIFDNAKSAIVWRDGEFVAPDEQLIADAKGNAALNAVSNAEFNEDALASKTIVEYGLGESTTGFAIASFDGDGSARDDEQSLYITFNGEKLIALSDIHLAGMHNVLNIMAALGICLQLGVSPELAVKHLYSFKSAPHRCVEIACVNDIRYIDDSKATNIGATVAALEGLAPTIQGKLILIAGGDAKGADIASLSPYLTKYVSHVFALGKDAHLFEKSFAHTTRVATMKDAVKAATRLAAPGDVVLLSPACASLDMFKNYMHRGDVFKQDVHDLHNLHSKDKGAVEVTS